MSTRCRPSSSAAWRRSRRCSSRVSARQPASRTRAIAAPSSSREQGLRSSSQLRRRAAVGLEQLGRIARHEHDRDVGRAAPARARRARCRACRAPSAMSVSSRSKRRAGADREQGLLGARRLADDAAERLEEAAHHGAHLGVVLDQQHRAGRARSAGRAAAAAAGAAASPRQRACTASPSCPRPGALSSVSAALRLLAKP